MTPNPILYLEKNDIGHDFIVGDIHGRLSALQKLLDKVCFDTDRDRLFCVGDMIDCGEDSMGVLKLAKNSPWFYTTIGNHEDMLLSAAPSPSFQLKRTRVSNKKINDCATSATISPHDFQSRTTPRLLARISGFRQYCSLPGEPSNPCYQDRFQLPTAPSPSMHRD